MNSELTNPCLKESQLSIDCLDKNNYDKEKCQAQFDNYNICKRFWGNVALYRRRRGIEPHLPEIKDRERIKEEFLTGKLK